jgi:predicted lipoprotein with Yx(FWY)xxD motif
MRRLLTSAAAATLVFLAACGSNYSGGQPASQPAASAPTVSIAEVKDVGSVLVTSSGLALYAADEEADGQVRCTGACTAFWKPLQPGQGTPSGAPGVANLAVINRPDGTRQVTADGKLLYTFEQDSPGHVTGDGFSDDFGNQHLTWHVVRSATSAVPNNTVSSTSPGGGSPDYGY